ncbi:MAG: 50S ribosomal protein L3 [Candidatus Woesearchaeota archaeon]
MAGANRIHKPHRGSMQFWPHKRAKRAYARVRSWKATADLKLLGFLGYKAGMTHIIMKDPNANSHTKGMDLMVPVTVIECPPMKVYSARYYKMGEDGLEVIDEVYSKKYEKELSRKIKPAKKEGKTPEDFDEVRVVAYTQPSMTGIGKKNPDLIEISIGGKDLKSKSDFALSLLEKDIKVSDVLKDGVVVDVRSVNKGKGFCGTIKKFGVKRLQHKAEKKKRGIGNLGSWHPKKVQYTVAQPGKFGYHLRTEYNKMNLLIGCKPELINPKGGFLHYGLVKNDYILIKGSVPGPAKRAVTVTEAMRPPLKFKQIQPQISYVSQESKQGR